MRRLGVDLRVGRGAGSVGDCLSTSWDVDGMSVGERVGLGLVECSWIEVRCEETDLVGARREEALLERRRSRRLAEASLRAARRASA